MATIKIVPQSDWDVLEKYFDRGTGVVLIPEPMLESNFPQLMVQAIKEKDGAEIDYDFGGGDPDFYVDVVTAPMHYAVNEILGDDPEDI